ncbi:MAG: ParB/RepB/Spo0J family partition protein [Candidatus Moraniibacteriota bacterium]|jgi:ParB family transcriptional regulator, chromosome partitioning protein
MAQEHGLGRGLSSLIPQKNNSSDDVEKMRPVTKKQSIMHGATKRIVTKKPVKVSVDKKVQEKSQEQKVVSDDIDVEKIDRDFVEDVAIGMVRANSQQPRIYFDDDKLDELTSSIKTHGILQPLIAIHKGDHYELIAGERRLRASKKAGLKNVPVVVKRGEDFSEQKKLELALIENVQRHDLNLIEEAKSYKKLAEEFDLSQEEIAVRTGKSRSAVANRMRLVSLPIEIQKGLMTSKITEGHAKVIMSMSNPQKQLALYKLITDENLTVRQAENKLLGFSSEKRARRITERTPQARRLEDQLTRYFGTKVRVKESASGGNITVSYFSEEELKGVLSKLKLS